MQLNERLIKVVMEGNNAQRRFVFDLPDGFLYFCIYNFPEYFNYKIPTFHYEMHEDLQALLAHEIDYLIWEMFREAAKTVVTRMFVVYCIAMQKKHYINWDSYDKANAEEALFMVATTLQTNNKIIADFGQLYYIDTKTKKRRGSKIQRLGNFVTSNDIKCEAFSTQESTRGRVFKQWRPDLFVMDDFETSKTKRSVAIISAIIAHIDEMLGGLNGQASVIFLCNYLSESGVVAYLLDKAKGNKQWRPRRVDAEENGEPSWPDRFALTDIEADAMNAGIQDPKKRKESLESKRRTLGDRVYGPEMMNKPEAAGDLVFDRAKITSAMEKAKARIKESPPENSGGFITYAKYQPNHRYAIGGDTAKGVGRDSNAAIGFDFTPIPAEQVSSYANKWIAPDNFGNELKREGMHFGECLLIPELNNTGYATVTRLKAIYDLGKIYRRRQVGKNVKATEDQPMQLGFDTNGATKSTIIFEFKTAWEDGHVVIWDIELLEEMRVFNQADFDNVGKTIDDAAHANVKITRHFDKLMAACLGWVGQSLAEPSLASQDVYKQAPIEAGEYEAGSGNPSGGIRPTYITDGFNKVIRVDDVGTQQTPYEAREFEQ